MSSDLTKCHNSDPVRIGMKTKNSDSPSNPSYCKTIDELRTIAFHSDSNEITSLDVLFDSDAVRTRVNFKTFNSDSQYTSSYSFGLVKI